MMLQNGRIRFDGFALCACAIVNVMFFLSLFLKQLSSNNHVRLRLNQHLNSSHSHSRINMNDLSSIYA